MRAFSIAGRAPLGSFKASLYDGRPFGADRRSDEEAADTIRRETVAELGRVSFSRLAAEQSKHNQQEKKKRMNDENGLKPWKRQKEERVRDDGSEDGAIHSA